LQAVAAEALGNWQAAGLNANQLAMLQGAQFEVTNLPTGWLGESLGNVVMIDATADGHGWSVGGPMAGQVDLLTVVEHEMGHLLGFSDVATGPGSANLMSESLGTGMRRGPDGSVSLGSTPTGIVTSADLVTSGDREGAVFVTGGNRDGTEPALPDGRGSFDWSSIDRFFAAGPQVEDAGPDAALINRLANGGWQHDAGSGQIQEERDDFFAASV
jgi:hypothetical protein